MKTSLISAGIHVGIVGLYMVLTPAVTSARPKPERSPITIYRPPSKPPNPINTTHREGGFSTTREILPPPIVPPTIPPIDVHTTDQTTLAIDTNWTTGSSEPHKGGGGSGLESPSVVRTADVVDVQVAPYAGAPAPRYPESLRAAGVEGDVTLEFVVDTAGRVERGSVRTISSTAGAFVVSVSEALNATRYHPALVGGRRVRQLVRQQFVFSLTQR